MPRLMPNNNTQVIDIPGPGSFQFSAVRMEKLGATEYTLVTVVLDISSSVVPFSRELLQCVKNIVSACKKSPRAENLLLRLLTFNTEVNEIHGFKLLSEIDPGDYKPFTPNGMTALYDATCSGVSATVIFAERLFEQDFDVNGCVYIITDGLDNVSRLNPGAIADKLQEATRQEKIESLVTVLIGLIDPKKRGSDDVRQALTEFQVEAELNQFIDAGDATPKRLAKLAQFVSQSISSQSQALGTGAASQQLTF